MRPRVLLLTVGFEIGGTEQLILTTAPRLARAGFDVTVACLKGWGPIGDELQAIGVRALALGAKGHADFRAVGRLIALLRRDRVQILHSHLFSANVAARILGRLTGVPVVITSHHDTDVWMRLRHRLAERMTAPLSDAIVTCSEAVRQYALKTYALNSGLVRTLRNGIAIPSNRIDVVTRERIRSSLGAGPADRIVGTVGRLDEPKKGLSTFLRAAGRLARIMQDVRFVIVGDGPLRSELQSLAERLGIVESVRLVGFRDDVVSVDAG